MTAVHDASLTAWSAYSRAAPPACRARAGLRPQPLTSLPSSLHCRTTAGLRRPRRPTAAEAAAAQAAVPLSTSLQFEVPYLAGAARRPRRRSASALIDTE